MANERHLSHSPKDSGQARGAESKEQPIDKYGFWDTLMEKINESPPPPKAFSQSEEVCDLFRSDMLARIVTGKQIGRAHV